MSVLPDPGWPDQYHLLQSPWDHHVHAFPDLGEVHSEAICTHSAATDRLIEPLPNARFCLACLLVQGESLWRS